MTQLENALLELMQEDCRLSLEKLAVMTGASCEEVAETIDRLEQEHVILRYAPTINWDKTDREYVTAMIELKITPQRDRGYDHIAQKIYNYPEVETLYLMSGGFDLAVFIKGRTMREVAFFVAEKLATLEDVVSTATHFVLRKYKDNNVVYGAVPVDERGNEF